MLAMLDGISPSAKSKTAKALTRIATVEAAIHGKPVDEVHFHELSGIDTIVDVAGAFIALDIMGFDKVICAPVNVGTGTVECAHGIMPVPAPATAALLAGCPVYAQFDGEMTTPTGALIVTETACSFGPMPGMNIVTIGYGAGGRECAHANVLRLFSGTDGAKASNDLPDSVYIASANIDDMDPRVCGYLMERLFRGGALDVFIQPVQMKKNRPGITFSVMCDAAFLPVAVDMLMKETPTLGVRVNECARYCAERKIEVIETTLGPLRVKIAEWEGKVLRVSPEFDDCARLARRAGIPVADIVKILTAEAESACMSRGDGTK